MTFSIYDLVYEYTNQLFPNKKLGKEQMKTIHLEIKELLKSGWACDELIVGFKGWALKHPDKPTIHPTKLFASKFVKTRNLLRPGKLYYHNILRLTPPPPKRKIDYDSGEITTVGETEYYLEMRSSITLDDIANYYFKQFGIKPASSIRKRTAGSLGYLLKNYDVETLLFMIDSAANERRSEDLSPPRTPLDLEDHYDEAKQILSAKRTEAVISGGDKIVRRKRVQAG